MKKILKLEATEKIIATLISIFAGMMFGLIIMLLISPSMAFGGLTAILLTGVSQGLPGFGNVLFNSAPLILTGLAVAFAFKTGLFNIGVSGQLMIGAFIAVFIGVQWGFLGPFHWIVAMLGGVLGGMLWALIPALLKAYRNVHEVVATIMMNYIAMYVSKMLIEATIYDTVRQEAREVIASGRIPKLFLDSIFDFNKLNGGIIFAVLVGALIYIVLEKTIFGFQLKAVGFNRDAAKYAGVNDKRNIIYSLLISGAIAGLAGAIIYLVPGTGIKLETKYVISPYGFQGIAVALLGMSNPIGTIFSGFFLGYIESANQELQSWDFKREIIDIISASIIYFSAFTLYFQKYARKYIGKLLTKKGGESHE
ncbi:ABC transporter permease [Acholeplasma vituli]|uniref:ABC transporter permease n=1 Tax=Paracholeplasma vituli TaxID=69473 RepID=A0ABT2PUZ0_9MOLU|nr:ABC transporter permease [Paracholeplasma vituli]MCU0104645.1 ABC transporter permease [Paracholeplasma vituli]